MTNTRREKQAQQHSIRMLTREVDEKQFDDRIVRQIASVIEFDEFIKKVRDSQEFRYDMVSISVLFICTAHKY